MTFDSAQFVDSGRTEARGAAAGARSRSAGDFQVEQVCHLAAALRKAPPPPAPPSLSDSLASRRQSGETFIITKKGGGERVQTREKASEI